MPHIELRKLAALEKINEINKDSAWEWMDISDFVFKSKSLVERERKIEQRKINNYFPAGIDERTDTLRRIRTERAVQRIECTYPYMLATGNFYAVLSLLETFLLMLAKEASVLFDKDYKGVSGVGVEKIYNHLRGAGIDLNKAENYQAISSAFNFRNCLIHCGGVLELSKEKDKIKRIICQRQHLSGVARENAKMEDSSVRGIAFVGHSAFGERLLINNDYAYLVSIYASSYFASVCSLVISRFLELSEFAGADDS